MKPCFYCGQPAEQVIHAENKQRIGWYCKTCKGFDRAVGRERVWK